MKDEQNVSAFQFHGNWKDFAKIAAVNVALTIVTLGIYRFWATTREREYLWSQTEFIDECLEWTGKGIELFIGFILVLIVVLIPFFIIQFVNQALLLQGQVAAAGLLTFSMLLIIMYLTGLARYRALRYRMARTYWRGIRGGSDDQGFSYGWSYIWKTVISYLALGLLVPWAMVSLWNERWGKMSFGPYQFVATGRAGDCFKRYLLFYLSPFLFFVAGVVGAFSFQFSGITANPFVTGLLVVFIFYFGLGLIALVYYAKFFRVVIDGLSLQNLDFSFQARTKDWFMLYLGDALLWIGAALVTILPIAVIAGSVGAFDGFANMTDLAQNPQLVTVMTFVIIGAIIIPFTFVGPFIRYRHWKFYVTYMHAYGEVNLDELTQSETARSKHGEGLLDAFDVGAI